MLAEVNQICDLVRKCGELIKNADRKAMKIQEKEGRANLVTEYDKKVQEILRAGLKEIVPDAGFIGEEEEKHTFSESGKFFIVDPIDGTTNFIKDYHMSCISVAMIEDGKGKIGVVYNPYLDEMYYAQKGCGAYCNGERIHVSDDDLENGLVLFGSSPYHEELSKKTFEMVYDYYLKALDVRRSGSAALDLCTVAIGRAELFFELILSPWDYAAGGLILEEAGGIITDMDGNPIVYDRPCSVFARNK